MGHVTAGIVALVLGASYGLRPPENQAPGTTVAEQDVRAASAKHYSELLRLACANGWKFRRSEVVAGLDRHFKEMRLILIDRGVTIIPLDGAAEPEVTGTLGLVEPSHLDRRGCFQVRWRKPPGKVPRFARDVRPVAN